METKRIGKSKLTEEVLEYAKASESLANLNRKAASDAITAVFESLSKILKEEGKVNVPGFGTFVVVTSAPRKARNPKTGEVIQVESRQRPKFRPSLRLRKILN